MDVGLDLTEVGMAIYGLGALIIAIAVMAWPLKAEPYDRQPPRVSE